MADTEKKTQPASWVGDTIEEFRKLPTWGKIIVGLVVVAVVWLAYYQYRQGKSATPNQAVSGSLLPPSAGSSQLPLTDNSTGSSSSGAPVIQPAPGPSSTPTPAPAHPENWYTNLLGKVGYGSVINPGGYDANGQRFWVGEGNKQFFYAPIGTQINRGANGRIWIQPPGQKGVLLTGTGQGSGGMSTSSFMADPLLYLKNYVPHKTTAGLS